jgi:Protein of unknown function (DUF3040)
MSLPACQQRALDRMEGALRASEPQLASMYAIFGRLNAGEPIAAEQLTRKRRRWLQQGTAMYAIVLVPVMFAAIIVGALLGGGTRSSAACEASYSVGGVSPLTTRPACPAKATVAKKAVRKTISAARLACGTSVQAVRFTTLAAGGQAFSPAVRTGVAAAGPPGAC